MKTAPWMVPAAIVSLLFLPIHAQKDPLIAKGVGQVISDGTWVWAFADSGTSFSRIDLFETPPAITTQADLLPGVDGGVGRTRSLLLRYHYATTDSSTRTGLLTLDRRDEIEADTLIFKHKKSASATVAEAVRLGLTGLAIWRDTAYVTAGAAGLASLPLHPEGEGVTVDQRADFRNWIPGENTLNPSVRCDFSGNDKSCWLDSLDAYIKDLGMPAILGPVAVDSVAPDSIYLWVGTQRGLWKRHLGTQEVTQVEFPGVADTADFKIVNIVTDSKNGRIWAFSTGRYAVSTDHGATFHIPPDVAGATSPANLQGFNAGPEALVLGDTTWVNFNLDRPGLILFSGDTVRTNEVGDGEDDDLSDILLNGADGLNIIAGEGRLTQLAAVASGSRRMVVVGSTAKGLFYLPVDRADDGWVNINRQLKLSSELNEIITYPTLFTAARPDGHPDYVNIGYRLKKSGKVTITVYNYAMEKVKVLVKNAPRLAGARSENPLEDRWDGLDKSGRSVSVGLYYVRVESDKGEGGWGKVLAVAGRK